ncbi:MAG: PilZ domain-containing protein [Oligoflexia bacterium]|nr:PilZ domain-containing protein [Oligoflexia bacterium]
MITVKRAHSHNEILQSLELLGKSMGLHTPWVLKQHALPSTTIITAVENQEVIAAITVFSPSAFGLPIEKEHPELKAFTDPKMLQLSTLAIKEGRKDTAKLATAILAYAFQFGRFYCHAETFLMNKSAYESAAQALEILQLRAKTWTGTSFQIDDFFGLEQRITQLDSYSLELPNPLYPYSPNRMDPETMKKLFIELTSTFENMSIRDFRVLRNLYDDQKFRNVLPQINESYSRLPKEQRYAIHCTGTLRSSNGQSYYVELLDISPSGMKLQLDYDLLNGHTYYLSLDLGPKKECEILAKCIWFHEETGLAGMQVTNKNNIWNDLFEYLKSISLKNCA